MRERLLHLDTVRWNVATIRRAQVRIWSSLRAAGPWLGEQWWLKQPARTAAAALVIAGAYYLSARVGLSIKFESSLISPIWPPNTILLVALLLVPAQIWWLCLLAVFGAHMLVELPSGISLAPAMGFYFTNAGEAVLGAFLVRRLSDGAPWLGTLRRVVVYVVCAVVAAPVITSFGDAAVATLARLPEGDNYWLNWQTRCVSNILAELTIGPALLLALTRAPTWKREVVRQRWIEAALLSAAVVVAGAVAFGGQISWHGSATTLVYAVLPVLLWAAVRFGVGGTSAALLGITVVATWSAAQGRGPFSAYSPTQNIIELQVFLISFSIPMLILAAVIEERQHALLALRASEARYRAVVRNLPNTVVLHFDGELRHSFADGPGLQMLGLTPDGLEGRTAWEAFPEDLAGALAPHYDAARSGQDSDVDVEHGQHIYRIQVVSMPAATASPGTPAAAPAPVGMVVLRDITEQRRARDELVQERTRAALLGALSQEFRTLAEHSPDLIARFDREGHIRYVNRAGAERLGLPAEHCVGKTFAELEIHQEVAAPWAQALRDVVATRAPCMFDVDTQSSEGQRRSVHVRFVPEFADIDGALVSVLGIATDISALKQAEARLAEQASELETIFESQADGVGVYDLQGRFVRANRALRDLLGLDADADYTALPFEERAQRLRLYDEQGEPLPLEQWPQWRVLRGEILAGASAMEAGVRTLDGRELWISITGAPVRAPDGQATGVVLIARDVTARRQLERQVAEQAAELEAIFEAQADVVVVYDRHRHFVRGNRAWEEFYQRSIAMRELDTQAAFNALPLADQMVWSTQEMWDEHGRLIPVEDQPTARALRGEIVTGSNAVDERFQSADGRDVQMSVTAAPIRDRAGQITGAVLVGRDVTARRALEQQVAQQASELEAIFEAKADAVAVYDLEGRFVRTNRALRELLGLDADPEYTARPLDERAQRLQLFDEQGHLLPPDQWPHWRVLRGEVLAGASAMEGRMRTVDGRELWVSTTGAPVCRPDGQVTGTVLITRDVTARRALERQVAEQATQLEAIFEAQADGVLVYDRDGRVVRTNRAWQAMFRHFSELSGLSSEPGFAALPFAEQIDRWAELERLNKYLLKDAHGHEIAWEETPTYRALRGETVMGANAIDERVEGPDGRVYETSVSAAPIRDAAGTIVGAVAVAREVTAHRQLERQVQDQASQLEAIFEAMADGVLVHDAQGHVLRVNQAYRRLLGLEADPDYLARSLSERVHQLRASDEQGQLLPEEHSTSQRVLRGEVMSGQHVMDVQMHTLDGREVWVNTSGAPIRTPDGQITGVVLISRDVTARRALERQVAEQAAAAERNRLARELHDTVTQEIFSAGVLAESIARNWQEHRAEAEAALAQLPTLTRGALAGLRVLLLELRPTTLEQLSLSALLRQLGEAMSARAKVPIAVRLTDSEGASNTVNAGTRDVTESAEPPLPLAVKAAFYRMAQEALMNAAKYARARTISVQLRTRSSHSSRYRGRNAGSGRDRDRDRIELEIADDGCGFDPSAIPAGHFGLAIMRERAQAVGATLQVHSQLGRGTRIVVAWHSAAAGEGRRRQAAGLHDEEAPHE